MVSLSQFIFLLNYKQIILTNTFENIIYKFYHTITYNNTTYFNEKSNNFKMSSFSKLITAIQGFGLNNK